jgi:hypothetical protein
MPNLKSFKSGVAQLSFVTASHHRMMALSLPFIFYGLFTEVLGPGAAQDEMLFIQAATEYVRCRWWLGEQGHTEESLVRLYSMGEFLQTCIVRCSWRSRAGDCRFWVKVHKILHWPMNIRRFGCPGNTNAETFEGAHPYFCKRHTRNLNFRDMAAEIKMLEAQDVSDLHLKPPPNDEDGEMDVYGHVIGEKGRLLYGNAKLSTQSLRRRSDADFLVRLLQYHGMLGANDADEGGLLDVLTKDRVKVFNRVWIKMHTCWQPCAKTSFLSYSIGESEPNDEIGQLLYAMEIDGIAVGIVRKARWIMHAAVCEDENGVVGVDKVYEYNARLKSRELMLRSFQYFEMERGLVKVARGHANTLVMDNPNNFVVIPLSNSGTESYPQTTGVALMMPDFAKMSPSKTSASDWDPRFYFLQNYILKA